MNKIPVEILFLGANARNMVYLGLGPEVREIREALERAPNGHAYHLKDETAVRPKDLQKLVLQPKLDLLHISGHGSGPDAGKAPRQGSRDLLPPEGKNGTAGSGGVLWLVGENGEAVAVESSELIKLIEIRQRKSPMRCVVLSACFSAPVAQTVADHVDCVIGMNGPIDDRSAIAFARAFYRALALEQSVQSAVDLGRNEIGLLKLPDKDVPQLFPRQGVNPDEVFIVPVDGDNPPPPRPSWISWFRRAAPVILVLSCIFAVAVPFLPPACVADAAPESSTIVVAGRWLGGGAGREARSTLCDALGKERKDGEGLVCMGLPLVGANEEGVRKKALEAGASLLIIVDENGTAKLSPLGKLANDDLLRRGLPRIDLSRAGSTGRLAPLLRSLAHISEDGASVTPGRIRCLPLTAEDSPGTLVLSLFTRMYARDCGPMDSASSQLLDACERKSSKDECSFAKYLYAVTFPDSVMTEKYLEELPEHLKNAAVLQSARLACRNEKFDTAAQVAKKLSESPRVCFHLAASVAAACLLSVQRPANPDGDAWLHRVESFADGKDVEACGRPMLGTILGERAWWRASAGRWNEAANDYEKAHELAPRNVYLLNRTEALLHQGDTERAFRTLKSLADPLLDSERIHQALLTWIAECRNQASGESARNNAAAALVDLYAKWPNQKAVLSGPPDKVLRPLACPGRTEPCVYDVLARLKTSISEGELRRALSAAQASPAPASP